MFVTRSSGRPQMGSAAELRDALIEFAEFRNKNGSQMSVAQDVWSTEGNAFHLVSRYESLAAAEESRTSALADPDIQSSASKILSLLDGPVSWQLWEVLSPTGSAQPPRFNLNVVIEPKVTEAHRLREILTDWVSYQQSQGQAIGLGQQVWGQDGARFVTQIPGQSIAELEQAWESARNDPRWPQLVADLAPVLARPTRWGLVEVLAPAPA